MGIPFQISESVIFESKLKILINKWEALKMFRNAIIIYSTILLALISFSCTSENSLQAKQKILKRILPQIFFNDSCFKKNETNRVVEMFRKDAAFLSEQMGIDFELKPKNELLGSLSDCEKIAYIKMILDEAWFNSMSIDKIQNILTNKVPYRTYYIPDNMQYIIVEFSQKFPDYKFPCDTTEANNRLVPIDPGFSIVFSNLVTACGCCNK